MSSWAERVHRRAADLGNVVTSCGHPATAPAYPYRLEKVKFGVPLEEVCKHNNNIPGPLLVLILKLNKESPNRRDVFRAPGHQGAMKKLIHFLQAGRLVNVDNYSVFTIASVLKKFLRKIPNGIFGRSGEMELFAINDLQNEYEQTERLHRLFGSLPKYTQHLLVLLFGTFRVIASNAAHASTGMTSEALGVSVAPSFFQSCVSDGKTARMEDVLKFKVSTKIMQNIIDKFATHDIFGRDNYEYYARVTGRILKVQDEWICSFQYPPPPRGKLAQQKYALQHSLEAEKTWLQCQCERWGLLAQEESRSTPALLTSSSSALENSVLSLGVSPEHSFIESCARLSVSLEGPGIYAMTSSPLPAKRNGNGNGNGNATDYDYDDYADDDEDNDELDGVHDFGAELEISSIAPPQGSRGIYRHKQRAQQPHHYQQHQQQVQLQQQRDYEDDDDEDEDEMTFVKRRYRQNKKKPAPPSSSHHQRRLRTGTKSLDGGGERRTGSGSVSGAAGGSGGAAPAANPTPPKLKQRTCSRCNRGIRHSSSCSSNSAGATGSNNGGGSGNGNGGGAEGGMTMEELRAVNRYAESTKSLSYLPQVHERQTARMRTRSEWFLGPRDAVVTLQLPADTCSNCCLAAAAGYLGGGSTRDMRQAQTDGERSQAALLYHFYRRQQQQQQQQQQQLEQRFEDMMDTEDSYGQQKEQQQQEQQQIHSKGLLRPPPMQHQQQQQQRRLLLDVNSVGNIRLSNSAESIQYAARRPVASLGLNPGLGGATNTTHNPTTRRLLINVPRQYRSSLRRNKEKQIGGNSQSNSSNSLGSDQLTGNPGSVGGSAGGIGVPVLNKPLLMVGLLPGAEQPPSVRNSIAECGISTPDAMDVGVECSTTLSFKPPRL
ncbi:uncharacterized protein RhoGAP71E isoform X1 [Drosophila takahashii]|uniref:uncharacterized protein RhoGAP71E isoform X1 n=1 Tax=Drosophila takahashii TaxID=29030 RepID=UPI001CF894EE|nr:uncharacterized protein LOC108058736 isoform X1 [Drosophila takahashii]